MKLTYEDYEKLVSENSAHGVEILWNAIPVKVSPYLTMAKMMEFVSTAASMCFSNDGEYLPEVLDFAIQSNIVGMYTDLELPEDLEQRYALVTNTNLVPTIMEFIDQYQFREMTKAIDRKLRHLSDSDVAKARTDIVRLFEMFEQMQEKMSGAMEVLASDDITKIASAVSGDGFDMDKLVKAYANQLREGGAVV